MNSSRTAVGGSTGPNGLAFGPDGNSLLCVAAYSAVLRYDGTTGDFLDEFVESGAGGLDWPRKTAIPFGRQALREHGSGDNVLRYDGTTGEFLDEFISSGSGGLNYATDMALGPDGNLLR